VTYAASQGASRLGDLGRAGQRKGYGYRKVPWLSEASQPVLEPAGGVRDDDEGRQRSATYMVKAAPADEARAVRHTRHREVPVPETLRAGTIASALRSEHVPRIE